MSSFVVQPWIKNTLTSLYWYPIDPYRSKICFKLIQCFESVRASCFAVTNISINMYTFLVFIFLNFYYSLLSERVAHIGHQIAGQPKKAKADIYRNVIELIKFHLKINE